jgi:predicted  nucleic acid-binding Zn-ribbon protein
MSHSCAVCGAVYDSLAELDNGACPACHACKFIYEAPKGTNSVKAGSLFEDDSSEIAPKYQENKIAETIEDTADDTTVSVRIQRPGSYEINLLQMSESSDSVIGVEKKGVYHLDLHSMVGKKKKK